MNPFDFLKNINFEEIKKKSEEITRQLKEITVEGSAGGGVVRVRINGEFNIVSIEFEESTFLKEDLAMFKDLIIIAHNDAVLRMKEEIKNKFSQHFLFGNF